MHLPATLFAVIACFGFSVSSHAAEAKPSWQAEWERTVKAAEEEGQLTVYIAGYGAILDAGVFQKTFPKIKVISVTGSGTQLAPRIVSERRAEKFLADVYNGGGTSLYQMLYLGKMLEPLKPELLLPEVVDPSKWWRQAQVVDKEQRLHVCLRGHVSAERCRRITPTGEPQNSNLLGFLNPKYKSKIVSIDTGSALGLAIQYLYYHPELGPEFMRRF
jgi:hypothetical protein